MLCTVVLSFGQILKVPAFATENFKEKYPKATHVEWKSNLSSHTADFDLNGVKHHAKFSNKGEWVSTEHEVANADLPSAVKDGLGKSKYAEWTPGKFTAIELPGSQMQYRVQVSKSDIQKKNLLFSSDGRLLKDNITL